MTLKEYLATHQIDQTAFADSIGFTQQAVSQWASGATIPRRGALGLITKATNGAVTANDFLPPSASAAQEIEAAQ